MEKALLVTVILDSKISGAERKQKAGELKDLALSTGVEVKQELLCFRDSITADLFLGKGKAEEIRQLCEEEGVNTVIFNNDLSGTQQRNLEEVLEKKTIDRTQLILDIFARHAKTLEGNMHVELAQLEYLLPRLTGKGIILSRLGGGIGTRGPGEQKLEVDRRKIKDRINRLRKELEDVVERRQTMRKKRSESSIPTVTLVGYTSAGKSTLLNFLTGSSQRVSKYLFTTLDTLSRSLHLSNNQKVILSDTVGFIEDLPTHLIDAFKATLEEVVYADLLIHVLDASDERLYEKNDAVWNVLERLNVTNKPLITALNKIDKLTDRSWLEKYKRDFEDSVAISALSGENLGQLSELIQKKLEKMVAAVSLDLPLNRMDLVDLIYKEGRVKSIEYTPQSIKIRAVLPSVTSYKLKSYVNNNA